MQCQARNLMIQIDRNKSLNYERNVIIIKYSELNSLQIFDSTEHFGEHYFVIIHST